MRRRRLLVLGAAVVLAVSGTAGTVMATTRGDEETDRCADRDRARVERTTLSSGLTLSGRLGYGAPTRVPGTGTGVLTALPAAGDVVATGQVLYAVDGRPVLTAPGTTPLWRDLAVGDRGPDVVALREALTAMGYAAGGAGDDRFDDALSSAMGALYRDRGFPEPKDLPEASTLREEAEQDLAAARVELAQARAALTERTAGPTSGERARAEAAVASAQRALDAARAAEQSAAAGAAAGSDEVGPDEDPDAGPDGAGTGGATPGPATVPSEVPPAVPSVAEATEQLRTAQAELSDLDATGDATAERAQVAAAGAALRTAEDAVAAARANGVRAGEIVMVPHDAVRVDSVSAVLGQTAAETVLTWTGTSVRAYADLTPAQAQQVATGTEVDVTLPDSSVVPGTVAAVEPAGSGQDAEQSVPRMVVDLPDQGALTELGLPAVKLRLPSQEAADALVVPVTALLALAEGGYALEVVDDGASCGVLVPVEVGLVADARAQVLPGDAEEGQEVLLP